MQSIRNMLLGTSHMVFGIFLYLIGLEILGVIIVLSGFVLCWYGFWHDKEY